MGIQPYDPDMSRSEDDIRRMVSDSEKGGEIDPVESRLIDNVFDFADRVAREVMVPRQDMICLFVEDSLEENLKVVHDSGHTRYPLCEEDRDHILGMIHIRELMNLDQHDPHADLKSIMREIDVVRKYTQKPIDCHMMNMNPGRYIEMMAQHGIDIVYIHPESELIPSETLDKIHRLGMKAGIVVNPCTSIAGIKPLLPQCEYVMMMGVNPGFAGRDFMDYLVPKFKEISDLRQQEKQDFHIILDGGADRRVISMLYHDCGIEGYVLGKQMYFFQEKSYAECAKEIREI